MSEQGVLSTQDLRSIFERELASIGGQVTQAYEDSSRIIARGVLPSVVHVVPGDRIRAGLAFRANSEGVALHPYTFREICRNGAIMAEVVGTQVLTFGDLDSKEESASAFAEAIHACAAPEVFREVVGRMREAREIRADFLINLLSMLASLGLDRRHAHRSEILKRFLRDEENSLYGLFNAVTSVARDVSHPETKWRLEKLGGGVLALRSPWESPGDTYAEEVGLGLLSS